MLDLNLCDYSDGYIVVKRRISIRGTNDANKRNKKVSFKNNAQFRSCISKINNTFIDNAEDLDVVMLRYNLSEHNNNDNNNNNNDNNNYNNNNRITNKKTIKIKSFDYKTELIGSTPNNNNILNAEFVVPLKYLSNFWRSLDWLSINSEIELGLRWTKSCVISEISRPFRAVPNVDPLGYEMVTEALVQHFK